MTVSVLVAGIFGLVIGSFLNVLIARYGTPRSALAGRSMCPNCQRTLGALELVPVVSFAVLRGRCRGCGQPISWRYPIIELITALGTMAIVAVYPAGLGLVAVLLAYWTALVICVIDFDHYLIPDRAVLVLFLAAILWRLSGSDISQSLLVGLLGAVLGAGFLGSLVLLTRGRGMGLGDVKLAGALGMFLGWKLLIIGLFTAFILGAIVGIGLLGFRLRRFGDAVPFGPFLLIGASIAMIWGEPLYRWYLGL